MPPKTKTEQTIDKINRNRKLSYEEARDAVLHLKELVVSSSADETDLESKQNMHQLFRVMQASQKNDELLREFYTPIHRVLAARRPTKEFKRDTYPNVDIPEVATIRSRKAAERARALAKARKAQALAERRERERPHRNVIPVSAESIAAEYAASGSQYVPDR
jgi:hypothetical protein